MLVLQSVWVVSLLCRKHFEGVWSECIGVFSIVAGIATVLMQGATSTRLLYVYYIHNSDNKNERK